MNKLVVLTDLGTFKAYRWEEDGYSSTPRLQPVDSFENVEGDDRISRRLADQSGQFKKGAPAMAATHDQDDGERHNIWLENERRCLKMITDRLSDLLGDGEFDSCYFAASNEINNAILEALPPKARRKIEKNVHRNLVNAPRDQILNHFV
jgi:hypothetical protein